MAVDQGGQPKMQPHEGLIMRGKHQEIGWQIGAQAMAALDPFLQGIVREVGRMDADIG